MDKLKLAHEYLRDIIKVSGGNIDVVEMPEAAWKLADAMQAEADKRKDKTRPEVLEEWQPDWSQAPDDATAWEHLGHGSARWHTTTKGMYRAADLFGYSGIDMLLVERPHGF